MFRGCGTLVYVTLRRRRRREDHSIVLKKESLSDAIDHPIGLTEWTLSSLFNPLTHTTIVK